MDFPDDQVRFDQTIIWTCDLVASVTAAGADIGKDFCVSSGRGYTLKQLVIDALAVDVVRMS